VRCKDCVDERGLSETSLTDADDVELEPSLQQLLLDLLCDAVETDVASGENGIPLHALRHCGRHRGRWSQSRSRCG